ncbi:hypothetical protein BKA62DRAFT_20765 [Auriculariales sp. MPI-PUGE-AT-0066]|nr:hypothetical protein BKA62DRAFT_20765 [Auriculariales sp. MPI-PUGE-AT-0066]
MTCNNISRSYFTLEHCLLNGFRFVFTRQVRPMTLLTIGARPVCTRRFLALSLSISCVPLAAVQVYRRMSTSKAGTTPSQIVQRVSPTYDAAQASGAVHFFPSTIETHNEIGVEFEIRLCPALLKKPELPPPAFDAGNAPPSEHKSTHKDPFAPPYESALVIGELSNEDLEAEHVFLLNKFSVVQQHFLMVSKEYESQTSPLTPGDLVHAYQIMNASRSEGKSIFAFYNCGDRSGASQPHKHLQFIPIPQGGPPIERFARAQRVEDISRPFTLPGLPYAHFAYRFPTSFPSYSSAEQADALINAYLALLDLVVSTARHQPDERQAGGVGAPSYNVLLTLEHLHIIPRFQEKHQLEQTGEHLPVNSLGFAGALLVKSGEELDAVKVEGVAKILTGVGMLPVDIPSSTVHEAS